MNDKKTLNQTKATMPLNLTEMNFRIWVPNFLYDKLNGLIKAKYPNEDMISVEGLSRSDMQKRLKAGDIPDLMLTYDDDISKAVENNPNTFVNLTDHVISGNYASFKLGEIMQPSGEIYGLPFNSEPMVYYFNRNFIGFDINQPVTWEEFCEKARHLRGDDGEKTYMLPFPSESDVYTMMKAQGLCFYDDAGNISADGCYEVMSFFDYLDNNGVICPTEEDTDKVEQLFSGKIAGVLGNSRTLLAIQKKAEKTNKYHNWGVIRLPKSDSFQFDANIDGLSWLIKDTGNESINSNAVVFAESVLIDDMVSLCQDEKLVPVQNELIEQTKDLDEEKYFHEKVIHFMAKIGEDNPIPIKGVKSDALGKLLYKKTVNVIKKTNSIDEALAEFLAEMDGPLDDEQGSGNENMGFDLTYQLKLVVDKSPNKLVYKEGESFDKTGMRVCLEAYCEQTKKTEYYEVNNYIVNPSSHLKRGDNIVYVSYPYQGQVFKTAVNIKVLSSIKNTKNKASNAFGDFPKVNLYTGNVLYESADFSIGANRNSILISHVYNADVARFCPEQKTGLGQGWKLNVQQYIAEYEGLLYYCDAQGYMHEFKEKAIENSSNTYQDVEGEGLTLYKNRTFKDKENCYLLKDSGENYILFDEKGKMIRMISAPCSADNLETANAIVIEYRNSDDNDYTIKKVYNEHENKVSNGVLFEYQDDRLCTIYTNPESYLNVKDVMFFFDEDNRLKKRAIGEMVEQYEYSTFTHNLSTIVSQETGSVVQIYYNDNGTKVSSYSVGYRKEDNEFVEKSKNTFTYNCDDNTERLKSTDVTNEKGVCITYMFNSLGEIVSSFAKIGSNALYTLQNEPGNYITKYPSFPTINGKGTKQYDTGVSDELDYVELARTGEEKNRSFAVSCYVNLSFEESKKLYAIIKYKCLGVEFSKSVKIDNTATDAWQRVCIPITITWLSKKSPVITNVTFGICDEDGQAIAFRQSDMYVVPFSSTQVVLAKNLLENNDWLNVYDVLDNVTSVKITYSSGNEETLTTGKSVEINGCKATIQTLPLTYYDLLETAKSLNRNRNGDAEFYFAGGKGRYFGVKNVTLCIGEIEYQLLNLSTGACKVCLLQIAPDGSSKTLIWTRFEESGICTNTTIFVDEKNSTSSELTSYDGRKLWEKDAYLIETKYEYDKYLNLTQIKRIGKNGEQMLVSKAEYDNNGEYLQNTSAGFSSSAYEYNLPYDSVKRQIERSFDLDNQTYTQTSLRKNIEHDINGRVCSVKLNDGKNDILCNDITYEAGKIRTVTDGRSKYGIKYDMPQDTVTYTVFDGDQEIDLQKHWQKALFNGETESYEYYYRGSGVTDETDTIIAKSDKYGKALSLSDGNKTIKYSYTTEFNGYYGANLIKTIEDPYENRTYTYSYDYDGKMCGWKSRRGGDSKLELRQISATETKYVFDGTEKYKTQVVYDDVVVNQPRLKGTKIYSDADSNKSDDWEELSIYNTKYTYDNLGRVYAKNAGNGCYTYEYYDDSPELTSTLKTLTYHFYTDSWPHRKFSYKHDNKGNIRQITHDNRKQEGGYETLSACTYEYDDANRVKSEKITANGKKAVDREYSYKNGRLVNITDKLVSLNSKAFYYDSRGRIKGYNQGALTYSYEYDNYGNVISKSNDNEQLYSCAWERGNLLKQVKSSWRTTSYEYNHRNVRFRKTTEYANGVKSVTTYYLDGTRILGEDRNGTKIRYFYDNDGLIGFSYDGKMYRYVKDAQDNIVCILNHYGDICAEYEYDYLGNTTVINKAGSNAPDVSRVNPFRWKSYYYDEETGLYNANGRYYETERAGYIDAMEADIIESSAYDLLALDRNGTMMLTLLMLAPYSATIATALELYSDPTYDPEYGKEPESWWEKSWFKIVISAVNIVVGIVKLCTGNVTGILNILSGVISIVGVILSEQLAGAMGTAMLGIQTIIIGIQSLSCSLAYGLVAMAIGASCVAFATAEAQEALGYGNWMKDAGMSDGWYNGLMVAVNIAAIAVNISGPKQCFKEGTLVVTENGTKRIEEISVGDKVLAYDESTGEQAYKKVVSLSRNVTMAWCSVVVNIDGKAEEIVSTPGHKYYLPNNTVYRDKNEKQEHQSYIGLSEKWVSAKDLQNGDKVLLSNGKYGIVSSVEIQELNNAETTYNFEVEDFHTYYVGEQGVCVHNLNCGNGFDSRTVAGPEDVGRYKDVRIDVEIGGSGRTNIHMQAKGLDKMYYDYDRASFSNAPKKLRESQFAKRGLEKAFDLIKRRGGW